MYTPEEIEQQVKKVEQLKKEVTRKVKEDRIEIYNIGKVHHKQVEFHYDTHRVKGFIAGNRVGKTVAGAVEAVSHALGYSRFRELKPSSGWVVSLTNEVQRDVAQKEILTWLPKKEIKDFVIRHGRKDDPANSIIDKIILKNGQTIGFKTCEQGRESFQGTSQGWIWFDEEPNEDIYKECQMRILDTRGDIWITMTPLKGLTWIYNLIILNEGNNPNISFLTAEWEDNPWLDKEEIAQMVSTMTDEERESRQYGRFTSLCGFAFPFMKKEIHIKPVVKIQDHYKRFITIDYGLDSTAIIWIYVDDKGKARVYRTFEKKNLIVSQAVEEIKSRTKEKIYLYLAPHDFWKRHNDTGKSNVDIFAEYGIYLTMSPKDRVLGWNMTREWLKPYKTINEQTGEEIMTADLTFDEGVADGLFKCMSNIQKDEHDSEDVSTQPHHITHFPDSLRGFASGWVYPSYSEKQKPKGKLIDILNKMNPKQAKRTTDWRR